MLIKEYRIPLPLSLEEYRIAQLYMIQKKSRVESKDRGSGVEIIINEPYINGPGGNGQYTKKIYHIGSHLPGWLKSLLPKSALCVEEEAWNAYPYTKTKTTCPFIEKFFVDVETYYCSDDGSQDNIFGFTSSERANIPVDIIDPIKDTVPSSSYKKEEDPQIFISKKTGRGPVNENWLKLHKATKSKSPIMCAYKLIKVEFKYWGMQSKIEHFIHDSLRNPILVGHRQAWSWQDEWYGLTISDIRRLEMEAQHELAKMLGSSPPLNGFANTADSNGYNLSPNDPRSSNNVSPMRSSQEVLLGIRMNAIEQRETESDSSADEDEFVDALESLDEEDHETANEMHTIGFFNHQTDFPTNQNLSISCPEDTPDTILVLVTYGGSVLDMDRDGSFRPKDFKTFETVFKQVCTLLYPNEKDVHLRLIDCPPVCPDIIDMLKLICINNGDRNYSSNDTSWLPAEFPVSSVPLFVTSSSRFQGAVRQMILSANEVYDKFVKEDCHSTNNIEVCVIADSIGSLLVHHALTCDEDRLDNLLSPVSFSEHAFSALGIAPDNGLSLSSVPKPVQSTRKSISLEGLSSIGGNRSSASTSYHRKCSSRGLSAFNFHVSDLFNVGSPIGLTISKMLVKNHNAEVVRPLCSQVYNIFHPFDPAATRLEPIIDGGFRSVSPVKIPKYQTFPFSQKILYDIGSAGFFMTSFDSSISDISATPQSPSERISSTDYESNSRKTSNASIDVHTNQIVGIGHVLNKRGATFRKTFGFGRQSYLMKLYDVFVGPIPWGNKRVDYALSCPDGLQNFPKHVLTQLCYNSYWESRDLMAFILWQILDKGRRSNTASYSHSGSKGLLPTMPKEKWQKRRTALKIKNLYANHRANDIVCSSSDLPTLSAKFVYGPVDVASLSGELVDLFLARQPLDDWKLTCTQLTDSSGRFKVKLPNEVLQGPGIYSAQLVVRGDHSSIDCTLAMLPPGIEAVVFSIDGSFLSGYSIRGIDPKIRGGAVDAVRHWQEQGYLIIYVTSRLLFQKGQVMSWLAQHNFPFGILSFCESLSKDIQKHKLQFLKLLVKSCVIIHAAYGSNKDIPVYASVGIQRKRMFILGKAKHQKQYPEVQFITDGYSSHLTSLSAHALSRPASAINSNIVPCWSFGRSKKSPKAKKKL